jgi:hypothetical protein
MRRAGGILAAFVLISSFTFIAGTVGSAGGCSGSGGAVDQAVRDEAADKVAQDKMREFMQDRAKRNQSQRRPPL